jgi:hypothetical protein
LIYQQPLGNIKLRAGQRVARKTFYIVSKIEKSGNFKTHPEKRFIKERVTGYTLYL